MESAESTAHAPDQSVVPPNSGPDLLQLYQMNDLAVWNHSDEELCAAARLVWRSRVYDHFDLGIQRVYRMNSAGIRVPDFLQYTFTCKVDPDRCQMKTRKRKSTGSWGTQNLKSAIRRCDKRRGAPDSLAVAQPTAVFSQAKLRALLCIWCAVSRRPFHILMDAIFLEIIFLLRPEAVVPCPQTISSDLARIYNRPSIRIRQEFMNRWMRTPMFPTARSVPAAPAHTAALTAYLTSPPLEKTEVERLGGLMVYWTAEEGRGNPVACMALDILTSPASSVDAERAFSGGRLAVNYRQHRTSLSTFRAKMAIGSWYGTPLLGDIDEVIDILNEDGPEDDEIVELMENLET